MTDPAEAPAPAAKPVITPTVGRVVWYSCDDADDRQPHDTSVNLVVFGHDGVPFSKLDVALVDDTQPGTCQWMPYQKGQAAKTEALEKKVAEDKTG